MLAGQDKPDTRQRLGLRQIDRDDAGMGMGRTKKIAAQEAHRFNVIDIASPAPQQIRIFFAGNRLTDTKLAHVSMPFKESAFRRNAGRVKGREEYRRVGMWAIGPKP
jgi:hypothetical protein